MLPSVFQAFIADSPFYPPFFVMARPAIENLFYDEQLNQLFDQNAEKQYTRELIFSQLVELMLAVVLKTRRFRPCRGSPWHRQG